MGLPLILGGCGQGESALAVMPPPVVKVAQPLSRNATEWDEYTGRVEAINAVDVRARVGGYLEKVNFTAGAKVNKGDLLFQIDPRPYKAQLNYATAELERARSRHELARNDLRRAESLYNEKAISAEEFDMRSKGLREAAAAVESAEANLYSARINLDYCEIRAPITGRIARELITAGNLVTGGDTTVLTSIVSIDPVYVYMDVDEQAVLKYRRQRLQQGRGSGDLKGTPVELAVADEAGYPHKGQIDYVSPREDAATGTVTLRAVFSNPDELLSPGFFAHSRVRSATPYSALLIPDKAIATDQAQRFVWVVSQDNHAAYRKVEPGARIGQMRVITQGLQAGEWVVVDGLQKLKPGAPVKAEQIVLTERQENQ
ncbi:MAG: efflux RND transporter periplasmic adaptor subunit [Methylococcales bacterium]|nr:efflux RND transporter periplasmic adaptor subunit [Methylococcales bacterium]